MTGHIESLQAAVMHVCVTLQYRPKIDNLYRLKFTSLCRSVLAWRKWFHKEGQGGHWRASGQLATPAPQLSREQLLDRYHQHTKNCPACSKVRAACRKPLWPCCECFPAKSAFICLWVMPHCVLNKAWPLRVLFRKALADHNYVPCH